MQEMSKESIVGTRERPERLQGGRVADLDALLDEPTARKRKKILSFPINLFTSPIYFPTCHVSTMYNH